MGRLAQCGAGFGRHLRHGDYAAALGVRVGAGRGVGVALRSAAGGSRDGAQAAAVAHRARPGQAPAVISGIREIPVSTFPWRPAFTPGPPLPRPLTPAILTREIPFGSGIGAGLLGGRASFFIRRLHRKGFPAVILLHTWQLVPPFELTRLGAKLRDLHVNPLLRPYTLNRAHALLKLLARNEFTSFRDHPSAMIQ